MEAGIEAVLEQHRAAQQHLKAAHEGQAEGAELTEAIQELHKSSRELNLTLQETPPSRKNLAKVQRDRYTDGFIFTHTETCLKMF